MNASSRSLVTPRPFLKWVGGKGQLLPNLLAEIDRAAPFKRYHEPFVGGAALFFEMARTGRLGRKIARLSDNNEHLIETYIRVRSDVDRVIELLQEHRRRHSKEYYYQVRSRVPDDALERCARIIYLNKTGYNGLYRENSKGQFNVPLGKYKNPRICDEENLRAAAVALRRATIECRPFEHVLYHVTTGDLVYFDPPYHPVSKTASFTAYEKGGFGEDAQRRLAHVVKELTASGVRVILSNSMTPLVQDLYRGFRIARVLATRAVNSRADRRGPISEALVTNF
jgi:DNA adenine methylase